MVTVLMLKAKFISLYLFSKIMLASLPFLSRWFFLGAMEDTRTVLFSFWVDLANDKMFLAIDCGLLFFRSLVPQWIMIRSGLFLSVGLICDSIPSVFAPGKDLTTNKSSLVDSLFNYGVSKNHRNTTTLFISLFYLAFMLMLIFF